MICEGLIFSRSLNENTALRRVVGGETFFELFGDLGVADFKFLLVELGALELRADLVPVAGV